MATQTTSTILNSAIAEAQDLLTQYALGEDLVDDLTTAFGASYDGDAAADLIEQWQTGVFESFPEVEIRAADEINGANGAFSADTNKIYISEEYLLANANNLDAISSLVLEEFGHFVDSQINSVDSAGDEGAIFSGLVRGGSFTEGELQQLQLENDQAIVNIDGQDIVIEQDTGTTLLDAGATLLNHSKISLDHLAFGDFDGNGKTDVFTAINNTWFVSYGGITLWQQLNVNSASLDELAFGDFDGDGKTDVFRTTGNTWEVYSGGTTRQELNVNSASLDELEFGDFDGDGKTDVFRADGSKWEVSYGGTSDWQLLNTSTAPLDELAFGDFNGDGKTDVFRADGSRWHVSYGGTSDWQLLNGSAFGVDRLAFGDFNGDGKTDVFRPGYVSYGGTSKWQQVQPGNIGLDSLAFGDFNGDNATDAFVAEGGAFYAFDSIGNQFGEQFIKEKTKARELPGDFDLRSHLTNVYVGDFNGDGFDDFIRQEKGKWDNDNKNTANVFINNKDNTFRKEELDDLGVNLKGDGVNLGYIKIGGTNLHIGDFNGDGKDDFLLQPKTKVNFGNDTTAHIFTSNGGDDPFQDDQKFDVEDGFGLIGDEINIYVGDFDGNGTDDILRQEKGELDNDNNGTAHIFYTEDAEDTKDGIISFKEEVDILPENFHIKGDQTTLFVGDFDGDGIDDFLRLGKPDSGIANQLFFSNGDGTFRRKNLENLSLSSNFDTIDVADINGDGKDDIFHFTYHEGSGSNRDETTYEYHLSHGDGTFGGGISGHGISGRSTLSQTHVELGDFNGDGNQDFFQLSGRGNDKNHITFLSSFESIVLSSVSDALVHGSAGNDDLSGSNGNDKLIGGRRNDTLEGRDGNDSLLGGAGKDSLDGGEGDDTLDGGSESDILDGGEGNDILDGGSENDFLDGGEGNDTLGGGNGEDILKGGNGEDILKGGDDDDTLKGGDDDDILNGDSGNDRLEGGTGIDILNGSSGDDTLAGGAGDDILDGGSGLDIASFKGDIVGYDIEINDESITVTDIDLNNGDEGTDTLTNISQLAFGGTRFAGDNTRNTVQSVAGVNIDEKVTTFISGGTADATDFIIDMKGNGGSLALNFNNQQLATFINTITLPNEDIELARLAANIRFDQAGGLFGSLPFVGSFGAGTIAVAQTLANYGFDQQQIKAQKDAADEAVKNFNSLDFGAIEETIQETVIIEDFQIGVDTLILPTAEGVDGGYSINDRTLGNKKGVMISVSKDGDTFDLVYIVNETSLDPAKFEAQIKNLESIQTGSTVLNTFNQKPQLIRVNSDRRAIAFGTFAGDHLFGEKLDDVPADGDKGGDYQFVGEFGDDLLTGNVGNDDLHGGFLGDGFVVIDPETGLESLVDGIFTYQDDGFDTLQGGLGDDTLRGGSGNDLLDGGGFNYLSEDPLTGRAAVLTNDGTDRLVGGLGNDTFIFNTLSTGIDIIEDFEVRVDKIRISADTFGATDISQFSFDQSNGALSFGSQQFAFLENFASLQGFDVNEDIQLVFPNNPPLV